MAKLIESGKLYTETLLTKYSAEAEEYLKYELGIEPTSEAYKAFGIVPDEIVEGPQPGNVLTTVGINQLWRRCATTDQIWDATHGAIATGDSSTAHAASDTNLLGSNKYYRVWDAVPTVGADNGSTTTAIFVSTFGTSVGNYAWNEYAVVLPSTGTAYTSGTTKQTDYIILNRKAGAGLLGTKTSAQSWVFTVTMTLA